MWLFDLLQTVQKLLQLLGTLEQWITETPPVDQPSRFGNKAYRTWFGKLDRVRTDTFLEWVIFMPQVQIHIINFNSYYFFLRVSMTVGTTFLSGPLYFGVFETIKLITKSSYKSHWNRWITVQYILQCYNVYCTLEKKRYIRRTILTHFQPAVWCPIINTRWRTFPCQYYRTGVRLQTTHYICHRFTSRCKYDFAQLWFLFFNSLMCISLQLSYWLNQPLDVFFYELAKDGIKSFL